jgi:hypothetical protein
VGTDTRQGAHDAKGVKMSRPDEPEDKGGFFSGWSKRKLAARRHAAPDDEIEALPEAQTAPDIAAPQVPQEEIDEDVVAALPSLDEIMDGSDIKPFLAKGVPAKLKNAAMRRLWLATPGVRDYSDPAVDYAWDWNAPGGVPGGGGSLSEAGVAKMVKGLIGEREDISPEQTADVVLAEADPAARETAELGPATAEDDVPPSPVRRSEADDPAETETPPREAADEAISKDETSKKTQPAPRRHGGAAPD